MPANSADPFPTDALEANRGGYLTAEQRDRMRPLARSARQTAVVAATGRTGTRFYWLDMGDGTFRAASRRSYDAAPDAGMVRVFFLPRSRRVVNLERPPDVAFAPGTTPQDVIASLGAAVFSHSRREVSEIRAKMAPVMDAARPARDEPVTPPP